MNRDAAEAPKNGIELEYDLDEPPQKSGAPSALQRSVKTGCRTRLWRNLTRSTSNLARKCATGCVKTFHHFWKAP